MVTQLICACVHACMIHVSLVARPPRGLGTRIYSVTRECTTCVCMCVCGCVFVSAGVGLQHVIARGTCHD